jgi:hypothetical protein
LADELKVFSEREQRALFTRFNIPEEICCEEIALELYRIVWQHDIAHKDNWQEATRNPIFHDVASDLSKIELSYSYLTTKKRDKYEFYTFSLDYSEVACRDSLIYLDCLPYCILCFYSNGNPESCRFLSNYYEFSEDGKSGGLSFELPFDINKKGVPNSDNTYTVQLGYVEWENGKMIFNEQIKNTKNFIDIYKRAIKESVPHDFKPSVLNKKPIKPITLESEKDYSLHIPDAIDPDTRKIFFKVTNQYKTLKDGQVKKILNDIYPEPSKYSKAMAMFRFGKNYLYDVTFAEGYSRETNGNYFKFDEKSRVTMWLNGDLREIDNEFLRGLKDPLKVRYTIDGDGVEIRFHPTGFPKTYRTIVRNRLFGRQIEWDENGKIISNVDIDFPQKWENAPQKNEKK